MGLSKEQRYFPELCVVPGDCGSYIEQLRDKPISMHRASFFLDIKSCMLKAVTHPMRSIGSYEVAIGYRIAATHEENTKNRC